MCLVHANGKYYGGLMVVTKRKFNSFNLLTSPKKKLIHLMLQKLSSENALKRGFVSINRQIQEHLS